MGTRSTIALEFVNGVVGQVYCHWDGYLEHNGKILQEFYQDPFKVRELIDHGDLSSLGPDIGIRHPFDIPGRYGDAEYMAYKEQYGKMCKFYGRDRKEFGTNARNFTSYEEYLEDGQCKEYNYILRRDGKWYVSRSEPEQFILLTEALGNLKV